MGVEKNIYDIVEKKLLLSGDKIEHLRDVVSSLLHQQFIRRGSEKDFEHYEFIRRNENTVRELLYLCGLELKHNSDYLFYCVISGDGKNRANLSQSETIILLILRLLYEEAMTELKVINGISAVTNRDIHEKYRAFINTEKPMDKTNYRNTIVSLKQYGIVDYNGAFSHDPEFMIKILPTITVVIENAKIQSLELKLRDFSKAKVDG